MQAFLLGYLLISICEIFSVGAFPLNDKVRLVGLTFDTTPSWENVSVTDIMGRPLALSTLAPSRQPHGPSSSTASSATS